MIDIYIYLKKEFMELNQREKALYSRLQNEMHTKREIPPIYHSVLNEDTEDLPLIIRKAYAFRQVMSEMPVTVNEKELIVGMAAKSSVGKGGLFPEYATEEEKESAKEKDISPYSVWGHYVPNYPRIFKSGLKGLREDADRRLNDVRKLKNANSDRGAFYEAVIICCDAVGTLAHRYAAVASRLADREQGKGRKQELRKISQICMNVPEYPPETFQEALQSFWFLHLTFHSTLNLIPIGRFDQYIYPFLQKDLENRTLTLRQAQELIDCLWLKFNERYKDRELVQDFLDPYAFHVGGLKIELDKDILHQLWLQNMILGGQTPEGKDATNPLTYLCLNATQKYELSNPTVTVRFFKNTPRGLLKKTAEIIQQGGGQPAIYNDEVIIPALLKAGIPIEEARDYANDGCWETLIPGKTEFRYYLINSALCVDLALNRGYCRKCGKKLGIDTPDPITFTSFEDLLEAYKLQLDHQIRKYMSIVVNYYGSLYEIAPLPFLSATVDDCMEKGLDITQGGAKYIIHALLLLGFSHAVDSLAAVKKLVYEEGSVSMGELLDALSNNFEGNEALRQMLITRGPKYGNDDDYSDHLAKELLSSYVEIVRTNARAYQSCRIKFFTGVATFEFFIMGGLMVGALPSGRLSGEPVSSNFSPSLGSALEGATATVNSFTKINFEDLPSGSPVDLSLDKRVVDGKEGLDRLVAFIQSFLDKGGNMMTISINSVEDLKRAQEEPEKYRHLRVRVGGWQAYFVDLTKEHQDHQIARLELYA
jgi:pyruvate formate-lyase/glycerol dehydratase family glycyl radical enzyme